jgi:hypothetical protein
VLVLACKRDDPSKTIDKPNDPSSSTSATVDTKPRKAKGRCVDGTYEKEAPESLGLDQLAFHSASADSVGIGAAGSTPPTPPPYALVVSTEAAPPGADPDEGAHVICDRLDDVRRCFDAVRSKISFHEYVVARVAVDADGDATKVTKVGDDGLEECLTKTLKVTNLPKPAAEGAWQWRFSVMPPAGSTAGNIDDVGAVDQGSITKVMRGSARSLKACYEKALTAGAPASGKISIGFTIETTGTVSKAHVVGGTITDPGVVSCILGVVTALHFPEPTTGAGDVVMPLNLVAAK